ncbi:MAG: radical SAM family heme chaperone HemW [Smithellaceae bacterium]
MTAPSSNNESPQPGLYIHIPFCLSKCGYCSFYSIRSINLISEFLSALKREMEFYSNHFPSFDTIYIGGGTPSLLAVRKVAEIFIAINKFYKIHATAEITMEVNPSDVSFEYFQSVRSLGINRLNIGIQSFDNDILKILGRRHSAKDAVAAIDAARSAGFTNIGIDLIYGVHHQDISLWKRTLQKALTFAPEHISCYQLSLEDKTPLHKKYSAEGIELPKEEQQVEFFLVTAEDLKKAGYIHYEVSNFACNDNLKSRHNMKYWQHVSYLGLGPAAHSFSDNKRWWNKPSVKNYLREIAQGKMPIENTEELTAKQLQLEALFLSLRTKAGIDLERYKTKYGVNLLVDKKTIIDALTKNKLVKLKNGFLMPTRAGMAVADSLALI